MKEIKNYVLDVEQKDMLRVEQILRELHERGTIAYDDCEKFTYITKDIASYYIRVRPGVEIEEIRGELEKAGITLL